MPIKKKRSTTRELVKSAMTTGVALEDGVIVSAARMRALATPTRHALVGSIASEVGASPANPGIFASTPTMSHPTGIVADGVISINGITIGEAWQPQFPSLTTHRTAICECQKCPLGATRTKFVYGVGNAQADVMFIGEAPGQKEDELGEPFVGRAGQLLDKILAAIKFQRSDVYIANILKCRPPQNRDPLPEEMAQCFPYLKEQIALIRPRLLCALGRISAQALLNTTTPIGKLRGQWHSYQGIPLLVTYHPAALLRNPNFKVGCWEDVKILRAAYEALPKPVSAIPA